MYLQKVTEIVEIAAGKDFLGKFLFKDLKSSGMFASQKPRVLQLYKVSALQAERSRSNSSLFQPEEGRKKKI